MFEKEAFKLSLASEKCTILGGVVSQIAFKLGRTHMCTCSLSLLMTREHQLLCFIFCSPLNNRTGGNKMKTLGQVKQHFS